MTFAQLRTFLALVRTGSVRAAAIELVVTEPAVSSAVTSLSKEVGVPLVERDGRGIRLTGAGEAFARYAAEIVALADQAPQAARVAAGAEGGRLRIGAMTTAGEYVLPPILKAWRGDHPQVRISLEIGNRASIFERLRRREIDLAVGGRPPLDDVIHGEILMPNQLIVVAAPDHPLAQSERIEPEELSSETWLMRETGSGTRKSAVGFLAKAGVGVEQELALGSNGAVKQAAAVGLGIALLGIHAVSAELATGTLSRLRVVGTPLERHWHVLVNSRQELFGPAAAFLEFIRSDAARHSVDAAIPPKVLEPIV